MSPTCANVSNGFATPSVMAEGVGLPARRAGSGFRASLLTLAAERPLQSNLVRISGGCRLPARIFRTVLPLLGDGGRGGIRTHGRFLADARFRVECLKPDSATLPGQRDAERCGPLCMRRQCLQIRRMIRHREPVTPTQPWSIKIGRSYVNGVATRPPKLFCHGHINQPKNFSLFRLPPPHFALHFVCPAGANPHILCF